MWAVLWWDLDCPSTEGLWTDDDGEPLTFDCPQDAHDCLNRLYNLPQFSHLAFQVVRTAGTPTGRDFIPLTR